MDVMKTTVVIALLGLAACSGGFDRAAYLNTLVGQDETALVRQLGVPSRVFDTPGHHFLAYRQQRVDYIPGGPFFGGGYGRGFGYGYGGLGFGFPPEIVERQCETTFDVVGGRVQSWALRGDACN